MKKNFISSGPYETVGMRRLILIFAVRFSSKDTILRGDSNK